MSEMNLSEFNIRKFDPSVSAYIEASAGTGKTYTIQRIVAKLIGMGKARLPEILLVTYTDKATGELKDRIRKILETAVRGDADGKKLFKEAFGRETMSDAELARFRQALSDIDLASIYTIHSFCERMISSFAFETNAALSLAQTSEDAVTALVEKACRDEWPEDATFRKIVGNDSEIKKLVKNVSAALQKYIPETTDLDAVPSQIAALFSEADIREFAFAVGVEKKDTVLFKKYLNELKKHVKDIDDDKFAKKISAFVGELENWDETKDLCAGKGSVFFETAKGFACIRDAACFFELAKTMAKDATFGQQIFIAEETKRLYAEWQKFKRANKQQTFNDMILNVYNRVAGSPDSALSRAIRSKYKFAIIDEFQDTNLLQWGIFSTIFLGQRDNHIFVVGDPKQSIYSFQGANVKVYRNAIKEIGVGYSLTTNHRSSPAMVTACNTIFGNENFAKSVDFTETDFGSAFPCSKSSETIATATFEESDFAPVWLSAPMISPRDFARFAIARLADLFKINSGKTALQLPGEGGELRNVRYSDIAVLAKSRLEMLYIERELASAGVPFLRYKDDSLFSSRECAHWAALLRAIDTPDNSLRNQRVIRAALLTLFLRDSADESDALDRAETFSFENESDPFLMQLEKWRELSRKKYWAQLLEQIYADTSIEEKLSGPSYLQTLAKIRQIGDYIVSVLYTDGCSLEEMARHLENLRSKDVGAEQDAAYVAKGTDKDAVQVMTIHASKGLEFPVVIVPGGFKGEVISSAVYLQDGDASAEEKAILKRRLVFGHNREISKSTYSEWHRLFYVAYTRAAHLLILPRYETETEKGKKKNPDAIFIEPAISDIKNKIDGNAFPGNNFKFFSPSACFAGDSFLKVFADYEKAMLKSDDGTPISIECVSLKMSEIKKHPLYRWCTSYSQIAHSDHSEQSAQTNVSEEGRHDKEDAPEADADELLQKNAPAEECPPMIADPTFPRGTSIGTAIHSVFELSDFPAIGNLTEDDCVSDVALCERIRDAFLENGLAIASHPEWTKEVAGLVSRTLNAELPEICGGTITGKKFQLKELSGESRRAEMMFQMNGGDRWLCKGFIDLVFRRESGDGKVRYSILDWKSDSLSAYDNDSLEAQIQKMNYTVQRALYSYFLIRWLKGFFPGEDESSIFENHFGGIYYVFFRGCQNGRMAGIYAKPFKNYEELESLYKENIQDPMRNPNNRLEDK